MEWVEWKIGDIAVDPLGRRWRVLAVDDGNILEYPEIEAELIESVSSPAYKGVLSARLLKKES